MPIPKEVIEAARKNVEEITPAETKARLDRGEVDLIVDVREPDEWQQGHIPGALHVPMALLQEQADPNSAVTNPNLGDKKARIVVQCAKGIRSLVSAHELKKLGYESVWSMAEGIIGWAKEGLPVER